MTGGRFDRQERLFGKEGQAKIAACHVAVIGVGGLGTHVVQQLAHLGVGHLALIDSEELDETNRNRYIGARDNDPVPGSKKVDLAERMVRDINAAVSVSKLDCSFISQQGYEMLRAADVVFGCLDEDGPRFVLNEVCAAYDRRYLDLASDVIPGPPLAYGGRVCTIWERPGCVMCYDLLGQEALAAALGTAEQQATRAAIYGVPRSDLDEAGPAVVSINGTVASLAVTEFMCGITGLRQPRAVLTYHAHRGTVSAATDPPHPDCYYCSSILGRGDDAGILRYLPSSEERAR